MWFIRLADQENKSQTHCEWCSGCLDCRHLRLARVQGRDRRGLINKDLKDGGLYVCDTCYAARDLIEAAIILRPLVSA